MEGCHQFLDLIRGGSSSSRVAETSHDEQKIELSLGPPGGDWSTRKKDHESGFPYGRFSNGSFARNSILSPPWEVLTKVTQELQNKVSSPTPANTAVPNSCNSQKRTCQTSVVGWPPIRSFRKNLANGSSSTTQSMNKECGGENLLVKINMDGVPIGRKIDLKAYDCYEKLSIAVDELFRGLAAQTSSSGDGIMNKSREYTLVYEDHEGDKMLVGDVPWSFFVSTVKRLRVVKSSNVTKLQGGDKLHDAFI